jgi:hypothetical protein
MLERMCHLCGNEFQIAVIYSDWLRYSLNMPCQLPPAMKSATRVRSVNFGLSHHTERVLEDLVLSLDMA